MTLDCTLGNGDLSKTFLLIRYRATNENEYLKCLWQICFYFLVRFFIRFWCEKRKKFPHSDFPSPRFSRLKTWNFTSGWVKNRVKRETGDSCVVMCHREHIDNQNEREMRDNRDDTCQQPGNPSLFLCHSSLSVNYMPSYQASVEFDSYQESGDSDLSETAKVIVKYDLVWSWNCNSWGIKCIGLGTRRSLHGRAISRQQLDRRIRQRSIGGRTEEPGITKKIW